jgi:hypothetical protein
VGRGVFLDDLFKEVYKGLEAMSHYVRLKLIMFHRQRGLLGTADKVYEKSD